MAASPSSFSTLPFPARGQTFCSAEGTPSAKEINEKERILTKGTTGQAISVLEQVFRDFHALYGDEILTVTLPIFNGLYASGSVLLASPIYKRYLLSQHANQEAWRLTERLSIGA